MAAAKFSLAGSGEAAVAGSGDTRSSSFGLEPALRRDYFLRQTIFGIPVFGAVAFP